MRAAAIIVGILLWATPTQPQILQFSGSTNAAFVGPLDIVSGAKGCWAFRACSSALRGTKLANICNSGDANCADISSLSSNGNFDVTTAQGSPLNCGGAGGTCTVKTLYDQTGNGNDATNGTAATRPTLVFSCLGSLPCADYVGTQTLLGTFGTTSAQPYTMSAVAERTGTFTTQGTILAFNGTAAQLLFASTANNVAIFAGVSVPTASATDSAFHAFQALFNGASSNINVDGTGNSVSLGGGTASISTSVCVGSDSGVVCSASNPFKGRLTEGIVWTGDQSASFTALCHNQFVYWGTSTSC